MQQYDKIRHVAVAQKTILDQEFIKTKTTDFAELSRKYNLPVRAFTYESIDREAKQEKF